MRLSIIGPPSTVSVIQQVAAAEFPDIEIDPHTSVFYESSAQTAEAIQSERQADALLFSGPTNYHYAHKRVEPTIPWDYVPHNRVSLVHALSRAMVIYHDDLHSISIDRYSEAFLREVLSSIGVHDSRIYQAPFNEEELDFEHKLLDFHRRNYREGRVSLCMTNMEHIVEPLKQEGIPCIRILPSQESIRDRIYHLQVMHLSSQENRGKHAVIAVHYDYIFDAEHDLAIREWEKVHYQNEFKERIYTLAQQMDAAVFDAFDRFYLVTTSANMQNIFMKNQEYAKLTEFGMRSPNYKVWLGIGVGATMLEAKSRSNMALNHSKDTHSGAAFLAENELQPSIVQEFDSHAYAQFSAKRFLDRTHLGAATLQKLASILAETNPITSEELAARMGITSRSVNRILAKLEVEGCVATVGKHTTGKGRPARIMKIILPELPELTEP